MNDRLHLDIIKLQVKADFAGDDQQFSRHVHAGQIIPRVGLGKPQFHGFIDGGGKRHSILQHAEDHRQGTRQNTTERFHPVTRADQGLKRVNNGQARTDVCFVHELSMVARRRSPHFTVVADIGRVGFFVCCDHVESIGQEPCILSCQFFIGRAIDDGRVQQSQLLADGQDIINGPFDPFFIQFLSPGGQVDGVPAHQQFLAVGNRPHMQGLVIGRQCVVMFLKLLQKDGPDISTTQ